MVAETLRNMRRRRVRTVLTIWGIVIGIFALTVMGSMSEYFNLLLTNAERLASANIEIRPINRDPENQLTALTVQRLRRVEGIKEVLRSINDFLNEATDVNAGPPEMMRGVEPELIRYFLPSVNLAKGRWLEKGDTYHAVIGSDIARKRKLDVGETVLWRERQFTVVGILESTRTVPDQIVYAPLDTVRKVLNLPTDALVRPTTSLGVSMLEDAQERRIAFFSGLLVTPEDPSKADEVVARINEEVPRVVARPMAEVVNEIQVAFSVFQVIMLSGAILAAIIGGFSVANTMVMAVHERIREIGIKKAIGATPLDILKEHLIEAAFMGIAGGVLGVTIGYFATVFLNTVVAPALKATELWLPTPRLAIGALTFALIVSIGAGLYPAWMGARTDPVQALRSE